MVTGPGRATRLEDLARRRVPSATVQPPVNVLAAPPESVRVPAPRFSIPPAPLITPLIDGVRPSVSMIRLAPAGNAIAPLNVRGLAEISSLPARVSGFVNVPAAK